MKTAFTTVAIAAGVALAACGSSDQKNFDKSTEYGPNPTLPEPTRGCCRTWKFRR